MSRLLSNSIFIVFLLYTSCSKLPVEPISQPTDPRYIARGKLLVEGLAACGSCHAKNLTGKVVINPDGQEILAPNLRDAGIREQGASYLFAAIKASGMEDDDQFSSWAHAGFEWMSDEDTLSIVSYIKLLEPVQSSDSKINSDQQEEQTENARNNTDFIADSVSTVGYVPTINKNFQLAYGKYLVDNVARCQVCHNGVAGTFSDEEYLAGGKQIFIAGREEPVEVPALKVSGWSQEQIINYLKSESVRKNKSNACPTPYYSRSSNEDLMAIVTYLKSLAG